MRPRSAHSSEYKYLAEKLRETRKSKGLTQELVAARLGKPRSFTFKVETAERELNVIELMDYCAALEEDFAGFITRLAVEVRDLRSHLDDPT